MTSITVRVDDRTKIEAGNILSSLGMDFSTAMRTFLQQVILHKGLPYDVTLPNDEWSIEDETWDNLRPKVKEQFYESEQLMQDKTAGMALNEAFSELGI